jgi:hypothetical protein
MVPGVGFADFSEVMHFERIELEREKGVLVLRADGAAICVPGPANLPGWKGTGHGERLKAKG